MKKKLQGEQGIAARESRSRLMIVFFTVAIMVAIWAAVATQIHLNRVRQAESEEADAVAKVRAYEQALARQVELFDAQLQALQHEWQEGPAMFAQTVAELRKGSLRHYEISVAVIDLEGRMVFLDAPGSTVPAKPLSAVGRDYFDYFIQAPSRSNQLFIGELVASRLSGRMVTPFARPLRDENGHLSGVLALVVYPEYLVRLGGFIDLEEADRLILLDRNGQVVTSTHPELFAPGSHLSGAAKPREGQSKGVMLVDDQVMAWKSLRDYPFTIVLQASNSADRRHSREIERSYLLFAGLPLLGMLAFVALLLRDLGQRGQALRKLARSELLAASVVNAMAEGVIRTDGAGIILDVNAAASTILGIEREFLIGLSAVSDDWLVIKPDGGECLGADLPASLVLRTGKPQKDITLGFVRPDGSRVWLNTSARPLAAEVGGGVLMSFSDVTRVMDSVLEASLGSAVVQAMAQAVVVTDRSGCIVRINPAFEELYGYTRREAVGRPAGFYRADRHDREFYRRMWSSLAERGHWEGEVWNRHRNGVALLVWAAISVVRDEAGQVAHYVALYQDITEKKRTEEEMWFGANHDVLTQLPNRRLFNDRLDKALAVAERGAEKVGLLFIDLDHFKPVNDTYGHAVGDGLLVQVAGRLTALVRGSDTVARLAGDEFVILLTGVVTIDDVRRVADGVVAALAQPFEVEATTLEISASVGVVLFPDHGHNLDALVRAADRAMYQAKAAGRNRYVMAETGS
ncbi:hypothetical protein OTERR_23060 [Oryzomicrobium terrae]|uniref:Diguanylate cyclase n=1 Tax=Oryzomicrobium terrae TaxID=1735038 RepID=A0A5C1EA42_9RHOO|nr:diguanylate cyclase [Oryzomicrobium terrae]QEL65782.1 hypothetical protein OTERR_23060 [Oryzomicrobium terrae]